MNVNEHRRGQRVITTATVHGNRLAADFPGWGDPNYADYLIPQQPGLTGTVVDVESHGSDPYTRYTVRFDDGTRDMGLAEGRDIQFTAGR
jgi:hypothetical protein